MGSILEEKGLDPTALSVAEENAAGEVLVLSSTPHIAPEVPIRKLVP